LSKFSICAFFATVPLAVVSCQNVPQAEATERTTSTKTEEAPRILTLTPGLIAQGRVSVTQAEKRDLIDNLVVTGQVIAPPHGKAEIGALLNARIRKIYVEEGAIVKKGQLLATLVAPDAARISGELAGARARRARAETVLAQEQRLAEQKATSERAVSDAKSDAAAARADEQAATVMLSSYNVKGSELTLRAPLDGVVAQSNALLGAQVDPDTTLFRIVDTTQLAVRADVPESMAVRIPIGTITEFRLPTRSDPCKAEVVATTRSVDLIKRTVGFRLRPVAECVGLLEGGFADVTIPLKPAVESATPNSPTNALASNHVAPATAAPSDVQLVTIPRSAVVELDGVPTTFVALPEEGKYQLTPLTVRRHSETHTLVEQGLTGNERVVSKGALLLKGEWMKQRLE
jgi:cobalt-zinc-cadmium efflux system membrane fusion protein